ncbi:MAG: membrane dipeptidase [Bdellovibrio sp.]
MLMNFILPSLLLLSFSVSQASVDLHMHLTMDVPLSPFYSGSVNDKASATSWSSRLKSRIDFEKLEESQLQLIVAAIYINPAWGDVEKQFNAQMDSLTKFTSLHPQWTIIKEPAEATAELAKGKKVILLSLEGAWFFHDQHLFTQLLQKYPIRIVTPLHFSDFSKNIGRPAKQKGLFAPIQAMLDFFMPYKYPALSPEGEQLFKYLVDNKIWIDLSHSSEPVIEYFLQTRPKGYPILMTHTVLKKYYGSDRGVDDKILALVAQEGGVLGILPSTEMLSNTPTQQGDCINGNPFLVQWNEVVEKAQLKNIYLGSDLNSPIPGLPPTNSHEKCPILPEGLRTAADLKTLGNIQDTDATTNFINQWQRVRN